MGHYDCKSCDATPYEEHSPDCERFGTKSPPTEGTDMNQIEKVARAFPALWNLVQYHKSGGHSGSGSDRTLANALRELAAIAAMQQEVIAWRYARTDGFVILVSKRYTDQHPAGDGWTEQALGVIPTPMDGGSDGAL